MSDLPVHSSIAAIVVAAGMGLRAGQQLPKQFVSWRGKPVVRHSVEALQHAGVGLVVVVIPSDAQDAASQALAGLDVQVVTGGATRQESVRHGLELLASGQTPPKLVFIHDAARPGLPQPVVERLSHALAENRAAVPVLPVVDSLLKNKAGIMEGVVKREDLRRVQTPQAFRFPDILAAHRQWDGPLDAGDDAQVAWAAGIEIALVEGDEALHKLTFASDFAKDESPVRVGSGYDVHRLSPDRELWLCGMRIEHELGLAGHSDADVAVHALVDAILGAAGAGDIGDHFPPSDEQWRGVQSEHFLRQAIKLAGQAGYRLGNADITIICEAPKIGPHRQAMRQRLAEILNVDISVVSVKATTTERLGFTGRSEGIAANATVCLIRT